MVFSQALSILGVKALLNSLLLTLAEVQPTVPDTYKWSWTGSAIIIGTCLICLFLIPRTIRYPHVGNKFPLGPLAGIFNNPSVGSFLAAMSAGHLIAIPAVLGLTNLGILK
jgi:photosystem I subunit X